MNNIELFISSMFLSFSGFVYAFYGRLSQAVSDEEVKLAVRKGYDVFSEEGVRYLGNRLERWKVGSFFLSTKSIVFGICIIISSVIVNYSVNTWWSSILLLIFGYILYLYISKYLAYRVQILSFIILLLSLIYIIYNFNKL